MAGAKHGKLIEQIDATTLSSLEICPFWIELIRRMNKEENPERILQEMLQASPLCKHEERKKDLMKYLLLFCATQEDLARWQALPEEERAQTRVRSGQWMAEHRAQILSDNGLQLPHTVTSVHTSADGQQLVTDGPFLEGTEVIGGYAEIEVADLDEALQLARSWADHRPAHRVVEIWPVVG